MRAVCGWSDACILNVSSRGLLINAPAVSATKGSTIELWHGDRVIVATVVWRKGSRAGLQTDDRVPVDDILALSSEKTAQLTAAPWPTADRRRKPRKNDDNRVRGRRLEFVATFLIGASLAGSAALMVEEALARPFDVVRSALG
jgi:hypothetical protein